MLLFIQLFVCRYFDCIQCILGFSCCPIICDCDCQRFRDVVLILLVIRVVYLFMCYAVLFNRVRLGRAIDFTGLPIYRFIGFIILSVLLCNVVIVFVASVLPILLC